MVTEEGRPAGPEKTIYEHTSVDKMLSRINVWFLPFRWGINTYRGCEHNCVYCNARYTHEFLGLSTGEFAHKIVVKDNAAEALGKQFSAEKWRSELTVNLATVSDPYQPAEKRFGITRSVLEVFLKHHNALLLTTKSDRVLKDVDLLAEIAATGFLNVVVSLATIDEGLRNEIEPLAASVNRRLKVIRELSRRGITVGVTMIPLLPLISDGEGDMEKLVRAAAEAGADYVIPDTLNMRGEARGRFMDFLGHRYSDLVKDYERLYATDSCDKQYAREVRRKASKLIKQYGVDNYDKMYSYRRKKD